MEDDLFSVFKSKPSIQAEASTSKRKLEETESSAKKRKLAATAHDESSEDEDGQPGKAPVVLDSFETEAQQQVQASKGLGGGIEAETEGGQISLTHQVRSIPVLLRR
jgi:nitric oxide reductase activation protein